MAQNKQHVEKAIGDANRGRLAAVRAAAGCARLSDYRVCGLRALEKSDHGAAALVTQHIIPAGTEIDEEIEITECAQLPDGRACIRMDGSVLMVVKKDECIIQADDDGEAFQVLFEANGEGKTWLSKAEVQVEFRNETTTIAHLGKKLHIILESERAEGSVNVVYDEGPVKQVTLMKDGHAGVRLREEATQMVTLEQAKERRALVTTARDEVKDSVPFVKEAVAAAEAMSARAKVARDAAAEKDKAFREARDKKASKDDGDGLVDVALEDGSLAKVSKVRVELVQLSEKFESAQLQFGNDDEWTWGCNGGMITKRKDGTALVKLTSDVSSSLNSKMSLKVARVQLMQTGDRIIAFEDGSRAQVMKNGAMSFIRDPTVLTFGEGFCSFTEKEARSRLDNNDNSFIYEEDSGLSWALRGDELVMLSEGHSFPEKQEAAKQERKKKKAEVKACAETGKPGIVEDAVSGEPLASAIVNARSLSTSKSGFTASSSTDTDGRYDLPRSEDVVICAEKAGYAPEAMQVSAKSQAFCSTLWPLTATEKFNSQSGVKVKYEGCSLHVQPGTVVSSDGSSHNGSARLDVCLPSMGDSLCLYAGIADDLKEKDAALGCQARIALETIAILPDGAPFPAAWTVGVDAERKQLPTRQRKSFLFRSIFQLPGCYCEPATERSIRIDVETAVFTLLQREYQKASSGKLLLDPPRLFVCRTALELVICGIAEVTDDKVCEVTPLLMEEAKKGPLKSALDKYGIHLFKKDPIRLQTTYETVVDWVSTGIYIDGIELPSLDEAALAQAHAEVNEMRALSKVAATLISAGGLSKEAEAASKLKSIPRALQDLASACLSLFADKKKTAEQVGGFNHFRKESKMLLGRCVQLNPYEVSETVIKRTEQLATKLDEAKLQADYPAAALVAAWILQFLKCAKALKAMGVAVKSSKMGFATERDFLDVTSPIPALTALRAAPLKPRVVEFVAPAPGWWTVDFSKGFGTAAGGGAAAVKALAQ